MNKCLFDKNTESNSQIALLLKLIDTISDLLIFKNTEAMYLGCNLAFEKFTGLSKKDIIGKTNFDLFPEDIANKLNESDVKVFKTKQPDYSEIWIYDSNGKHILFEVLKTPFFNDSGDVIGILCISRDITDHKLLEKSLIESKSYQKALLDNLPFMAWLKDTESKLLAVNEPYAKMCNASIDEIIGKTDLDLFPMGDAKEYIKDDLEVVNSRCKKTVEESIAGPSGITWHETYKTPIFDENNNVIGTAGIARDITEIKQAEQELLLKDKLFSVVAEAINELVKNLNFEEAIINAFGIIGSVINIDRIVLLESFYDKNNNIYSRFKHEWCSSAVYSMINNADTQNIPTYNIPDHVNTLLNKKPLIGNFKDMKSDFQKIMEFCSVRSIMLFPIYVGDIFWGQIGFDDCKSERNWSEAEKAILLLFASSIASVIERNQKRQQFEEEILSRDSLLIAVSEAINELVVTQDIYEAIINAFEMIGNIINVDRITLFENRFDKENNKLFSSYKYAWVSDPIYSQINDPTLQNMPIDHFHDINSSLIRKKIMVGNTEDMEPEFQKLLKSHDVCSIMLFPIHIEDNFWGFIGFDDCKSKRTWNEAEKAILITFAGSIAGVLERNQKREQEKNNERRISTILDNVQDGIVTISENCVIESCNPAIANIFGYSFEEIIGSALDLLLPHSCSCQDKKCNSEKRALQETFKYGADIKGRRKDGSAFPVEIDIKKIDFDNKSIVLMVIRDITQRKEFDRMKNEFVSTVSHELRTPLTSIKGSLGLITSGVFGVFPEKVNELLNIANNNCTRLTNLINDILDLEKIKAGKMEFKYEELEINSILEQSIVLNQSYADQFGMKVKMIKPDEEYFIKADKNRLLQVISNLFSNAVKFSKPGGEVTITSENINGKIKVSFIDKGVGIPEDSKHKIFKSFSQVDSSDSRSKGGSGLGLSICKLIIEKMDGEIDFDSVAGEGSTFFFIMPEITKSSIIEPDEGEIKELSGEAELW